jgi:hypothetical protein
MFYGFDVSYQFSLGAFVPFARATSRTEIEPEAGHHFGDKSKKQPEYPGIAPGVYSVLLGEQWKLSELLLDVLVVGFLPGVLVFFYFSFGWSNVQHRLNGRLR